LIAVEEKNNSIIQIEDLKVITKIFSKNWMFFLLLPLIFGLGAFFYSYRLSNIYSASSQIILKSKEHNFESPFSNPYSSYEETANQIRVIKSSNLLEEVVKKLNLNVSYYIQGRIKTSEVFKNVPFKVQSEMFGGNKV